MPEFLKKLYYRCFVYKSVARPDNFSYVRKGDVLVRVTPGFKKDTLWYTEAEVIEVTSTQIVCKVYVDVPRTMKFDRVTGQMQNLPEDWDPQWLEFPLTEEAKLAIK
ncbi:MAG: hypothetical protein ACOZAO_00625 [Patescibacteria group bacterium]